MSKNGSDAKVKVDGSIEKRLLEACSKSQIGLLPNEIMAQIPDISPSMFVKLANTLTAQGKLETVMIQNKVAYRSRGSAIKARKVQKTGNPQTVTVNLQDQNDIAVYKIIEMEGCTGISAEDIKLKIRLTLTSVRKILKSLENKGFVTSIAPVYATDANQKSKIYVATTFKPDTSITGGNIYSILEQDSAFVDELMDDIVSFLQIKFETNCPEENEWHKRNLHGFVSFDDIFKHLSLKYDSKIFLSNSDVNSLLQCLIYCAKIKKRVNGMEENNYGSDLYKVIEQKPPAIEVGLTALPCCYCKITQECTLNGQVNPRNCTYFDNWFNLF